MTTTEHTYLAPGYRIIPDWDGYMMNEKMEVWSLPREVPCKGGTTRLKAAKRIKNDEHGRITLSQDSRRGRFHVYNQLRPITFPELVEAEKKATRQRPQVACHKGHLLVGPINPVLARLADAIKPRITEWGTGNRICLWCSNPPKTFRTDNRYSMHYGVAAAPQYSDLPAQPKLFGRRENDGDRDQLAELEWGEHGFIISKSPL